MPLLALVALCSACGRRATHADCQLIVDRSVEIQRKEQSESDPKAIVKRKAEIRAELDDKINSCERDRRVTDKMMACVQSASTTSDLQTCLR
jgi:formiminotetrahydrofolate cyclodeaminase